MKKIIFLFCVVSYSFAIGDIVVIANKSIDIKDISMKDIKNIYLKNKKDIQGIKLTPIDNKNIKHSFDKKVLNKTQLQVNSYWAKMIFSGKNQPPVLLENDSLVVQRVLNNKNIIGYIKKDNIDSNIQTLLNIKEEK
jgi:ABC-type phosphate transport system substrate-binding protein